MESENSSKKQRTQRANLCTHCDSYGTNGLATLTNRRGWRFMSNRRGFVNTELLIYFMCEVTVLSKYSKI